MIFIDDTLQKWLDIHAIRCSFNQILKGKKLPHFRGRKY